MNDLYHTRIKKWSWWKDTYVFIEQTGIIELTGPKEDQCQKKKCNVAIWWWNISSSLMIEENLDQVQILAQARNFSILVSTHIIIVINKSLEGKCKVQKMIK